MFGAGSALSYHADFARFFIFQCSRLSCAFINTLCTVFGKINHTISSTAVCCNLSHCRPVCRHHFRLPRSIKILVGRRLTLEASVLQRSLSPSVLARQQIRAHSLLLRACSAEVARVATQMLCEAAGGELPPPPSASSSSVGPTVPLDFEGGLNPWSSGTCLRSSGGELDRGGGAERQQAAKRTRTSADPAPQPRQQQPQAAFPAALPPSSSSAHGSLVACGSGGVVLRVPRCRISGTLSQPVLDRVRKAASRGLSQLLGLAVPLRCVVSVADSLDPLEAQLV